MIFELLIVFLIVGFSVLFKYSELVGMDSQLTFICLCFLIILIYKSMMYYRMKNQLSIVENKEGFFNFADEVNRFINKDSYNEASPEDIKQYKDSLNNLNDKVTVMNEYLQQLNNISKGNTETGANTSYDELNIQASQQIQDYRIMQLQKDIEQTTDLIKKAKLRDDAKNFKKIPVYSSCIVSNADGSMSIDSPSTMSSNSTSINNTNNLENLLNQRLNQSRNNISVNDFSSQGQQINASSNGNNSNILSNLLSHVSEKGIDINISA